MVDSVLSLVAWLSLELPDLLQNLVDFFAEGVLFNRCFFDHFRQNSVRLDKPASLQLKVDIRIINIQKLQIG
jgi:hypothetical protein